MLGDEADQYSKVTDTLDVWFDSGVTHTAVLDAREQIQYPADYIWKALISIAVGFSHH